MSVEVRMASRTALELFLTIAGWAMAVAAIVMFLSGQAGPGVSLLVGAVIAFGISAASFKRRPPAHYAGDQMNHAIAFLRKRQYPQAVAAAQKATEIASSIDELKPSLSVSLVLLATARAANGDASGARRDLGAALLSADRYPNFAEDMRPVVRVLARELDRGVPDPDLLVRAVLDA